MKKTIILISVSLLHFNIFGQLNATFDKDTVAVERDQTIDQTIHLLINITSVNPAGGIPNTINFAINPSPATTMASVDYSFAGTPISITAGVRQADFLITIQHGENPANSTFYISVQLSYSNPAVQQKNTVLKIVNKESKKKSSLEIGALSIGHSFDFFGKENALISYADIYIFCPNSFSIGKNPDGEKYGFALKLYQNKSLTVDSLNSGGSIFKFINQTLVNPFQPPVNDSVLLKQELLTRKTSYKSTNWGMYLRLFRDISYTNKKTKFYLGLHGEFLRRNIETSYEYKSEKDTIIKVKSDKIPYLNSTPLKRNSVQSELYIAPFLQFLYTNDDIAGHFSLIPIGLNLYNSSVLDNTTNSKAFFLCQFDLVIKTINIKLGAECRGLYHVQSQPYWNVFISKSFTWEKLKELIL